MARIKGFFIVFLAIISLSISNSFAELSLAIESEEIPKTKIIFFGFDSNEQQLNRDITEIFDKIRNNLDTTDIFEILKQSNYVELEQLNVKERVAESKDKKSIQEEKSQIDLKKNNISIEEIPDFEKYSKIGASAIIVASFNYDIASNIEIKIRLWDVLDQKQLFGKYYSASPDKYQKVANIISDEIFMALTGELKGHFNSKILYVSESGSIKKRIKKINMMNFDGSEIRELTHGSDLVLTPIFSNDLNKIYYLRFFQGKSQIFEMDVHNQRSNKVGGFRGTTYAAATHPTDNNKILLSAIVDKNSDIYELNIQNNEARRLTKDKGIDTTPSYSPDGRFITFVSDRSGRQNIYVMDSKGLSLANISNGGGHYSKPVWSPDGRQLAFTKVQNGRFHIGVMSPNGQNEKILTSAYVAEGAKWSPNGRYLIYSKKLSAYGRRSIPRLFVIDVVTGHEFEVNTPKNIGASDPDWI